MPRIAHGGFLEAIRHRKLRKGDAGIRSPDTAIRHMLNAGRDRVSTTLAKVSTYPQKFAELKARAEISFLADPIVRKHVESKADVQVVRQVAGIAGPNRHDARHTAVDNPLLCDAG